MTPLQPVAPAERDPNLVMIGMPSIGNGVFDLVRTIVSLELQENKHGLKFVFYKCAEQGLGKARAILAHVARCVPASRVIFLDRDLTPKAEHFFRMALQTEPVVSAMYPLRESPLRWVGEYYDATEADTRRELWPMAHAGTGMLSVALSAIDAMIARYPETAFEYEDSVPGGNLKYGTVMHDLFGWGPVTDEWFGHAERPGLRRFSRLVTEDYMFCYRWRKMGGQVWADSGCQVGHLGTVDFLELESKIEARVDDALARYKADLEAAGVRVPTLLRDVEGKTIGAIGGRVGT